MPTIAALSLSDTLRSTRLPGPCRAIGGVVLDGLADRLDGAPDERPAVVRGPVTAALEARERPLEAGRDETREELVRAQRRVAVRPFVRHEEVGPEATRLVPQPL